MVPLPLSRRALRSTVSPFGPKAREPPAKSLATSALSSKWRSSVVSVNAFPFGSTPRAPTSSVQHLAAKVAPARAQSEGRPLLPPLDGVLGVEGPPLGPAREPLEGPELEGLDDLEPVHHPSP